MSALARSNCTDYHTHAQLHPLGPLNSRALCAGHPDTKEAAAGSNTADSKGLALRLERLEVSGLARFNCANYRSNAHLHSLAP